MMMMMMIMMMMMSTVRNESLALVETLSGQVDTLEAQKTSAKASLDTINGSCGGCLAAELVFLDVSIEARIANQYNTLTPIDWHHRRLWWRWW